jgi:hypothetical protein
VQSHDCGNAVVNMSAICLRPSVVETVESPRERAPLIR